MKTTHHRRHRNPHQDKKQDQPFFAHTKEARGKTEAKSGFFQPKLKVGQPGDAFEQEADSVADAVTADKGGRSMQAGAHSVQRYMTNAKEDEMGTNTQRIEKDKAVQEQPEVQAMDDKREEPVQTSTPPEEEQAAPQMQEEQEVQTKQEEEPQMQQDEEEMQTKEEEEPQMQEEEEAQTKEEEEPPMQKEEEEPQTQEEEETENVQMKAKGGTPAKKAAVSKKLRTQKGGGRPLPKDTRAKLENLMGADFSKVRIHTDREAEEMNKSLRAQAFAHGRDVFFNAGKFRPETTKGLHLLAHELTHVVQQGKAEKKDGKPGDQQ